jgi:dynein heavy chain, axonemal
MLAQDMDIAFKCYEWPAKMVRIMKEAITKATAEHKQFETQLKTRRKVFGDSVGTLQSRVDAFVIYDVSARRAEHTREVIELMAELKTAQQTAESINREERMFGWGATKYSNIDAIVVKLEPYHVLWTTAFEFFDKSNKWMNQPFKDIVAEDVEELVNDMYRKVYKLMKTFSGMSGQAEQEAPLKVAAEVRRMPAHILASFSAHSTADARVCCT